ncbi:hypothetical protein Sste5346_006129 [Sporothrix stenoceras]|uniref:Zn(2)-C6 fungal-type domain-containing protein n=1 Tax=Sporothrix stenoceras TaxID=5173 RepID=A0ABR3Z0F9_9PEZI
MATPDSNTRRPPRATAAKSMARSCQFCRRRKIKCDTRRPTCGSCVIHGRDCYYEAARWQSATTTTAAGWAQQQRRGSTDSGVVARDARRERQAVDVLLQLKNADPEKRNRILDAITQDGGRLEIFEEEDNDNDNGNDDDTSMTNGDDATDHTSVTAVVVAARSPMTPTRPPSNRPSPFRPRPARAFVHSPRQYVPEVRDGAQDDGVGDQDDNGSLSDGDDGETTPNVNEFFSVDESGRLDVFGPSSLRHAATETTPTNTADTAQAAQDQLVWRHTLVGSAALERQREYSLGHLPTIRGLPADLVLHLLNLHWNRQHHTYFLTYRPAFMRELVDGGAYCTDLLFYATLACSSKYSERPEVRDIPSDPTTAGRRFFAKCDALLVQEGVLSHSRLPTVISLLMLGSAFNAQGQTSKAWLHTGHALRMVFDLGLHLDAALPPGQHGSSTPEQLEIRRRVFWGAFICDKLQSLSLGRPPTIQLRDAAHVSRDLLDTYEELELWTPYIDHQNPHYIGANLPLTPTYAVSTFQHFCGLTKIITKITTTIYVVGATAEKANTHLHTIDRALQRWYANLPSYLAFEPWKQPSSPTKGNALIAPHIILLAMLYHAVTILLHRPFISNSHLKPKTILKDSWKKCSVAAHNITSLVLAYQTMHPLRRAQYLVSYCVYVACTIHVQNIATMSTDADKEKDTSLLHILHVCLDALDELAVPNSGTSHPAKIIRKLMQQHGIERSQGTQTVTALQEVVPHLASPPPLQLGSFGYGNTDTNANMNVNMNVNMNMHWSPDYDGMSELMPFVDFAPDNHDLLFGYMDDSLAQLVSPNGGFLGQAEQ